MPDKCSAAQKMANFKKHKMWFSLEKNNFKQQTHCFRLKTCLYIQIKFSWSWRVDVRGTHLEQQTRSKIKVVFPLMEAVVIKLHFLYKMGFNGSDIMPNWTWIEMKQNPYRLKWSILIGWCLSIKCYLANVFVNWNQQCYIFGFRQVLTQHWRHNSEYYIPFLPILYPVSPEIPLNQHTGPFRLWSLMTL